MLAWLCNEHEFSRGRRQFMRALLPPPPLSHMLNDSCLGVKLQRGWEQAPVTSQGVRAFYVFTAKIIQENMLSQSELASMQHCHNKSWFWSSYVDFPTRTWSTCTHVARMLCFSSFGTRDRVASEKSVPWQPQSSYFAQRRAVVVPFLYYTLRNQ